jgi:hypothetical protein
MSTYGLYYKTFYSDHEYFSNVQICFITTSHFYPCLIFASKAEAHIYVLHSEGRLLYTMV